MSISELGSLGEFISSLAVLATLIYLAVQIRQNTHATRATSHHAVTEALNQLNLALATDDSTAKTWRDGMRDRGALDDLQREQYDALLRAYLHVCDTMFYQARVGAGDHGLWKAEERYLGVVLNSEGGKAWWQENCQSVSVDFRRAAEEIARQAAAAGADALGMRYGSTP